MLVVISPLMNLYIFMVM